MGGIENETLLNFCIKKGLLVCNPFFSVFLLCILFDVPITGTLYLWRSWSLSIGDKSLSLPAFCRFGRMRSQICLIQFGAS